MEFTPDGVIHKSLKSFLKYISEETFPTVYKVEYQHSIRTYIRYINVPMSFDIETSSFYVGDEKCSCMYIWQFGVNGHVCYGRTWEQFSLFMEKLSVLLGLGDKQRAVIYVHNLAYEFQFIKDLFDWESVFARETRHPMYARSNTGYEFRCSYTLSGSSLEQTAKDCIKYKCAKKVGFLDYDKIRTYKTFLTTEEIEYCVYDVICVMNYIKEEMERYSNSIVKIPMTKTGKVRLRCKDHLLGPENRKKYRQIIKRLTLTYNEYKMLRDSFQGGFTHANWCEVGFVHNNVGSRDFTSSYPTVMIAEPFPMSKGEEIHLSSVEEMKELSKTHLMIFNVHFDSIKPKFKYEHYLSSSKCFRLNADMHRIPLGEKSKDCRVDNGRIIEAQDLYTTITNIDFEIIEKDYEIEGVTFFTGYKYRKGYLPKQFVEIIVELYEKKTTLKDVEEKVVEYMLSKADLNSLFGMAVTDIINDTIEFSGGTWLNHPTNKDQEEEIIEKYNKNPKRTLFYPWGVFVTAYARRNLWSGILELGSDYIYSDTDSVKYINDEKHRDYFDRYNKWITNKLIMACNYQGIDPARVTPVTIKGKKKPLGVWDDESHDTPIGKMYARRFKTLGAKRYMKEYWNDKNKTWDLEITIAGVSKKKGSEFMNDHKDEAFQLFDNYLTIPEDYSGRLISTYIDEGIDCTVTDYQGNVTDIQAHSGIHMEKSDYNLTLTEIYLKLLEGRTEELIA